MQKEDKRIPSQLYLGENEIAKHFYQIDHRGTRLNKHRHS